MLIWLYNKIYKINKKILNYYIGSINCVFQIKTILNVMKFFNKLNKI